MRLVKTSGRLLLDIGRLQLPPELPKRQLGAFLSSQKSKRCSLSSISKIGRSIRNVRILLPGCAAFKLHIKGYLGVIPLDNLDDAQLLRVIDNKGTGVAKLLAPKDSVPQEVDFAVCILGMEDGREVIFTFHPGDPIPPDTIKAEDLGRSSITVAEAKSLGFVYANLA